MPYAPQVWHDLPATDTPESAARFTVMEAGIQLGASNVLTPTSTKTSAYTAFAGDLVIVDSSAGTVTITAPAAVSGASFGVRKGDTSLNAVVINAAGSDTIGQVVSVSSMSLTTPGQIETFASTTAGGVWIPSPGRLSMSSLDNRYAKADAYPLATGEANVPRLNLAAMSQIATQALALTYFTAQKTETINAVKTYSGGTAGASLTLARIGVYSEAANGDITLVASIANDTTLWTSTNTTYTRSLSASWSKTAGQRYAVGVLAVGTTMPNFYGINLSNAAVLGNVLGGSPRIYGQVASQTDLPSSVSAASIANAAPRVIYAEFS